MLKGVRITKDSKSDSALIGHLYQKLGDGPELWNSLDGVFACVLYDEANNEFCAARCCKACHAERLCLSAAISCLRLGTLDPQACCATTGRHISDAALLRS